MEAPWRPPAPLIYSKIPARLDPNVQFNLSNTDRSYRSNQSGLKSFGVLKVKQFENVFPLESSKSIFSKNSLVVYHCQMCISHLLTLQLWVQSHVSIDWNHFQRWNGWLQFSIHDQWVWNPSLAQQLHPTRCDWSELSYLLLFELPSLGCNLWTHVNVDGWWCFSELNPCIIMTKMLLDPFSGEQVMFPPAFHLFLHLSLSGYSWQRVSYLKLNIYLFSSYSHILFICCRQEATVFHVSYYHLWQRKQSQNGCRRVWGHKNHHSHCLSECDCFTHISIL